MKNQFFKCAMTFSQARQSWKFFWKCNIFKKWTFVKYCFLFLLQWRSKRFVEKIYSHYLNRNKFVRRTGQGQEDSLSWDRSSCEFSVLYVLVFCACIIAIRLTDIYIYFIYKYHCRKVNRRDNERQYSRGQATIEQTIGQTVIGSEQITRSTYFLMK